MDQLGKKIYKANKLKNKFLLVNSLENWLYLFIGYI